MEYKRHPIEAIEGLGEQRAAQLRKHGIDTTEDLLALSEIVAMSILKKIPGFPAARYREFYSAAEFLQVDGLTGQHAEALLHAGRRSLLKLAAPSPLVLVEELKEAAQSGLIPDEIDLNTALGWQKQAIAIHYSGCIHGMVQNENGPVEGALIYCGGHIAKADAAGKFHLPIVPHGKGKIVVRADGYMRLQTFVNVQAGKHLLMKLQLRPGQSVEQEINEASGEMIRSIRPEDRVVFQDVEWESLQDGTLLILRHIYKDGRARFIGIHRTKVDTEIQVPRVKAPEGKLPSDAKIGTVYALEGSILSPQSESITEIRRNQRFNKALKVGRTLKPRKLVSTHGRLG